MRCRRRTWGMEIILSRGGGQRRTIVFVRTQGARPTPQRRPTYSGLTHTPIGNLLDGCWCGPSYFHGFRWHLPGRDEPRQYVSSFYRYYCIAASADPRGNIGHDCWSWRTAGIPASSTTVSSNGTTKQGARLSGPFPTSRRLDPQQSNGGQALCILGHTLMHRHDMHIPAALFRRGGSLALR